MLDVGGGMWEVEYVRCQYVRCLSPDILTYWRLLDGAAAEDVVSQVVDY